MNSFRLVPVLRDGTVQDPALTLPHGIVEMLDATRGLYASVGYDPPWVSYLSIVDDTAVGGSAFVGAPGAEGVEIAYFTLPGWQRKGYARRTAEALLNIVQIHAPLIAVWAKTLPTPNPSTVILERLNFRRDGMVQDHEIGEAWRWTRLPSSWRPVGRIADGALGAHDVG